MKTTLKFNETTGLVEIGWCGKVYSFECVSAALRFCDAHCLTIDQAM